jgi:hypothetical protein
MLAVQMAVESPDEHSSISVAHPLGEGLILGPPRCGLPGRRSAHIVSHMKKSPAMCRHEFTRAPVANTKMAWQASEAVSYEYVEVMLACGTNLDTTQLVSDRPISGELEKAMQKIRILR